MLSMTCVQPEYLVRQTDEQTASYLSRSASAFAAAAARSRSTLAEDRRARGGLAPRFPLPLLLPAWALPPVPPPHLPAAGQALLPGLALRLGLGLAVGLWPRREGRRPAGLRRVTGLRDGDRRPAVRRDGDAGERRGDRRRRGGEGDRRRGGGGDGGVRRRDFASRRGERDRRFRSGALESCLQNRGLKSSACLCLVMIHPLKVLKRNEAVWGVGRAVDVRGACQRLLLASAAACAGAPNWGASVPVLGRLDVLSCPTGADRFSCCVSGARQKRSFRCPGVSRYSQCNAGIEPLEHGKLLWAVLRYLRDADLLGLLRGLLLRSFSLRRLCHGRSSLSLLRLLLLLPRRCGDRDLRLAISTLTEEVTCQQVPC